MRGIEPLTPSLPRKYSTPELHRLLPTHKPKTSAPGFPISNNTAIILFVCQFIYPNPLPFLFVYFSSSILYRAGDEVRTRDLQLGRLSLYQLSYSRVKMWDTSLAPCICLANVWWGEKDSNLRNRSNGFTVRPI
jgi:hypothetical protein